MCNYVGLFRNVCGLGLGLATVGCATVLYVPNKQSADQIPLNIAEENAKDAIRDATGYYVKNIFSTPEKHFVTFTGFRVSADGTTATATFSLEGVSTECTISSNLWLGSWTKDGAILPPDSPGFPDDLGKAGSFCMNFRNVFNDCDFPFICWAQEQSAAKFVDAMTAIHDAAGPKYAQLLLEGELLPADYPANTFGSLVVESAAADLKQTSETALEATRSGDVEKAIALYTSAVKLYPQWTAGHYNLAVLLAGHREYANAANEMNTYLALDPTAPNAASAEKLVAQWQSAETATHH